MGGPNCPPVKEKYNNAYCVYLSVGSVYWIRSHMVKKLIT